MMHLPEELDIPDLDLFDIEDEELIDEPVYNISKNLAEELEPDTLRKISSDLLSDIKADIDSRGPWEDMLAEGIKYVGILRNNQKDPKNILSQVNDPILLLALLNWLSGTQDILGDNPVDYRVDGPSNEEIIRKSDNRVLFENHYLTIEDKEFRADHNRLRLYLGLAGCAFKNVYMHPVNNIPVSRFIKPQDMILDNNASTLNECERISYVYYLSKQSIAQRKEKGFFIEHDDLSSEKEQADYIENETKISIVIKDIYGIEDNYDKKSQFRYIQSLVYLDNKELLELEKEDIDYPLPYIVHICCQTNKIVAIFRGWDENDPKKKRLKLFCQYNFLPGLGLYGIGLVHLLSNAAEMLSVGTRLYLDAIQFSLYPAFLALSGSKLTNKNLQMQPGQVTEVQSMGGISIGDTIMPLPYRDPPPTMMNFLQQQRALFAPIDWTLFNKVQEQNINAPVGTTLSMIEVQHKIQSMVMEFFVESLTEELQMIDKLFQECFQDDPYVIQTGGKEIQISKDDFLANVTIIPSFKSDISTKVQKMMTNDAIMTGMQSNPALYDAREVHRRRLEAMKVDDIDAVIPKESEIIPLDPISENMLALQGKAIKAAEYQDHMAYIAIKNSFLQRPEVQQNPMATQIINANILEHYAMQYKLEMEQNMGIQLPPLEQMENPQIQNQIALKAFPISQQQQEAQKQSQPMDPVQAMMADVDAKLKIAQLNAELKEKELASRLQIEELKSELESYKASLKFESDKRKVESDMEMSEERNETNLEIEQIKHNIL